MSLLYVLPSVRTYQRDSHGTYFREIWCWGNFTNICLQKRNFIQIGRQYQTPYVKTSVNLVCFLQNDKKNRQLRSGFLDAFLPKSLMAPLVFVMSVRHVYISDLISLDEFL